MRKTIYLLSMAALLLAGCSKSDMQKQSPIGGDTDVLTSVTFTADVPDMSASQTKTYTPKSDGNAAKVNRCIMEIYYNKKLYGRYYKPVSGLKASFTVQVPANRTYDVLFWADCVEDASSDAGLATDKYYNTNTDEKGLTKVSILGTYAGNNDARDAFYHYESCTIEQGGTSKDFELGRPFSQINVYTTDVKYFKTATDAIPTSVIVTLKNAYTSFNMMEETLGDAKNLTYQASLYDFPDPADLGDVDKAKLSMDYVFAEASQAQIDIDWSSVLDYNEDVEHSFTSIPYRRNYRTNIIGDLLTAVGTWNVTIDPAWETPDYEKNVVSKTVDDIDGMNSFVAANPDADQYNVSFSDEPNDGGTPGVDEGAHSMLTSGLGEGKVLNVNVESDVNTLYIGDYESQDGIVLKTQGLNAAKVNINVPEGEKIKKLVINAPSKSVYLNGEQIASCGELDDVEASTSANTLVIESGQIIKKLTVRKGGLEIHGTVQTLVITPDEGAEVKVRTSENLSAAVFAVIKGEGHDYIDRPMYCEKQNGELWDIVPAECVIGTESAPVKGFASLEEAFAAAESGQTITLLADAELDAEILVNKEVTLDMNGHSINSDDVSAFQVNNGKLDITGKGKIYGNPSNCKEIYLKGSSDASASDYSVLNIGQDVKVSCESGYGVMISANNGCAYGAKITVDGQVEGYYGALYVNGSVNKSEGNVPEITVNGTLTANEEAAAVYAAGYAKYIYNSTAVVTGGDALYICGGETVINGGSFFGIGAKTAYSPEVSGYEQTGDAVVVDRKNGYPAMSVSVKDGSFKSANADAIASYSEVSGEELTGILGGGVYSTKPAASLAKESYYVVDNQDAMTKADYPWTVALPLPGEGTEDNPYQVSSAEDFAVLRVVMGESRDEVYFAMQNDIDVSSEDLISSAVPGVSGNKNVVLPVFKNGQFDGNGYELTLNGFDKAYLFGAVQNSTVKNLDVNFNSSKDASVAYVGNCAVFEDVETLGDIKWSTGNSGAFVVYIHGNLTLTDCVNRATLQTKTGDVTMYDAVFFGYATTPAEIKMTGCNNEGSLKCGKAGMFLANWSYGATSLRFTIENCKNNGEIRTFSADPTWKDYNYLTSGYWDKAAFVSFTIDGVTYSTSTTPKWYDIDAQGGVVGTGSFVKGGEDATLALTVNGDKTFTVTPSTAAAAYYVVSVGTYVGTTNGSTRVYATEQITGTTTELKYLNFVDAAWVAANPEAQTGTLAGNAIYTLGGESYYYVGDATYSVGGAAHAPEMVSVTAFDANSNIIAVAPLTE